MRSFLTFVDMKIGNLKNICLIDRSYCPWYHCDTCDKYDKYHKKPVDHTENEALLFDHNDVLRRTVKGGGLEYVYRPIILKPEAMQAKGIKVCVYNQIFVSVDGGGMFSHNPGSEIDGYLVSDTHRTKTIYTFGRQDFYGVPNERAVERFYELFQIDLRKYERK